MQHFVVVVNITLLLQTFVGQLDGGEGIKANRCEMLCSRFFDKTLWDVCPYTFFRLSNLVFTVAVVKGKQVRAKKRGHLKLFYLSCFILHEITYFCDSKNK